MRILCLADLHYRRPWFEWAVEQSHRHDLTCIAGDLLYDPQTFGRSPALPDWSGGATPGLRVQSDQVRELLGQAAAEGRLGRLALCSGNHDPVFLWQDKVGLAGLPAGRCLLDGARAEIGGWAVSALPYDLRGDGFRRRWREDHAWAAGRPWLVLCHVGPEGSRVTGGAREEQPVRELLGLHPPAVLLCGHIHRAPFRPDGAWAEKIGATWCLNPGAQECNEESYAYPPHVVIDTAAGTLVWSHAESAPAQPQRLDFAAPARFV
jgi:predicted phosphodiesterase